MNNLVQLFKALKYRLVKYYDRLIKRPENMVFDVKAFLRYHSPELFALVERRVNWNNLSRNYKARYDNLLAEHKAKGVVLYEASFFEILMYASEGRRDASYVLTFITENIQKLKRIMSPAETLCLADNFTGMVTNLDTKYLNFVGEIGVLVIIKEQLNWTLLATEVENAAKKRIDFEFETENNRKSRVEVLNIHLTKEVSDESESIRKFLEKRLLDKINSKTSSDPTKFDFILAPVIWGPVEELKKVSRFLKGSPWTVPKTLKPVAFVNFVDNKGGQFQKFKDLATIFD